MVRLSLVHQYFVLTFPPYRLIIEPWMLPAGKSTYINELEPPE